MMTEEGFLEQGSNLLRIRLWKEFELLNTEQDSIVQLTPPEPIPSLQTKDRFQFHLHWKCHETIHYSTRFQEFILLLTCLQTKYHSQHPSLPSHIPTDILRIIQSYLVPIRFIHLHLLFLIPLQYPTILPRVKLMESNIMKNLQLAAGLFDEEFYYDLSSLQANPMLTFAAIVLNLEADIMMETIIIQCPVFHRNDLLETFQFCVNPYEETIHNLIQLIEMKLTEKKYSFNHTKIQVAPKPAYRKVIFRNKSLYRNGYRKNCCRIDMVAT